MFSEAKFREILAPSYMSDDGRSISLNVASLNIPAHYVTDFLYYSLKSYYGKDKINLVIDFVIN